MTPTQFCDNCRRRIFRWRGYGEWYHRHNASVACNPGIPGRKAAP